MPKMVDQRFIGEAEMGQKWSEVDAVFMLIKKDERGGTEVWLEVSGSEPLVYRRKSNEELEPDVQGIVDAMVQAFNVDVHQLVVMGNKDSPSVHDSGQARV